MAVHKRIRSDGFTVYYSVYRGPVGRDRVKEPFAHVADEGVLPRTQNVRGSNHAQIAVVADRIEGRAIVISVLDNLVKGSAGQAIQNFNLMFGLEETTGLTQLPMFP